MTMHSAVMVSNLSVGEFGECRGNAYSFIWTITKLSETIGLPTKLAI